MYIIYQRNHFIISGRWNESIFFIK